ncbi:MAG: Jag N-terminal domain-containing protein [Thermomicrobiales bacterium]|nr:Jag N-terminal domain-containing protein [Thermomicrobiales bacterium]MCO5218919.1 Jag N-terminal domain-containing protein [Thermomicrobiales bacterium]MCO5225140.1 Jag N-terminal domain-containing protein [Thermomicrobiales bacterium]MCO5229196.1 Jag N-terminal domain-containing protein [Thermomicrobiales bacterium]
MAKRTSVEIQAVTVEDAVRLALEQLELTEADVDIEILSEEGPDEDAEALVRVTAKGMASQPIPGQKAANEDRGNRRRGRGGSGGGNGNRDWLGGRTPGDRPSRRGRPPVDNGEPRERADAEHEQIAKDLLQDLLAYMGVDASVVATDNPSAVPLSSDDPTTIFLDVNGRDLGMLIGRRGDHLSQIQFLINTLVNRKLNDWTRVIVDVEGYRARREESLVGLAERVARQVARSRRSIVLEPMPANERRIIHLTLKQHPDVVTHSDGEGSARRITVEPA